MILRSNGRYFDFNADIEVERRWKLFENLNQTDGDFSYRFEMDRTANNMEILGFPYPDSVKSIYRSMPCDVLDDDNIPFHIGHIRVEGLPTGKIVCSFFSGNYNWISQLGGSMQDLDFTQYDGPITLSNVENSWSNEEGRIFPLIDTGLLNTRSYRNIKLEDFVPGVFVKTIFQRITRSTGIKFTGDLFKDPIFNSMILVKQNVSQNDLEDRSSFANKTSDQAFTATGPGASITVQFQDDFNFPYYDGSKGNYDSSTGVYTADAPMFVVAEIDLGSITYISPSTPNISVRFFINGSNYATVYDSAFPGPTPASPIAINKISRQILLQSGDQLTVNVFAIGNNTVTIKANSTFKVTPLNILYVTGQNLVPDWTQSKFVSNIMSMFCCISDFDKGSNTVTIDFLNNLSSKDPIDLSDYVTQQDVDFQEIVSPYAKSNSLSYQPSSDEDLPDIVITYGVDDATINGNGIIRIDNDFIEDTGEIFKSDFSAPKTYVHPELRCSIERVDLFSANEIKSTEFTQVTNLLTAANFDLVNSVDFFDGDLVRITESTNDLYNGDWIVEENSGGNFTLVGLLFSADATGKITKITHNITNNQDVHLFVQTKYDSNQVPQYSARSSFIFSSGLTNDTVTDVAYPYFNLLSVGNTVNSLYRQSLSFGDVTDQRSYQRTITDSYWRNIERILNDPTKVYESAILPKSVFLSLTALRPIRIRTLETDNLYYLNRVSGYKNSYLPCDIELVKLS